MKNIFVVIANFYTDISKLLAEGAKEELEKLGCNYDIFEVAGALEIPTAIAMAIKTGKYDGYVALGCVIRGETSHYDIVCSESARGLNDLAMNKLVAIGNGILTVENKEQAIERADPARKNKGAEAVRACLSIINVYDKITAGDTG